jgi:hypothetical protein
MTNRETLSLKPFRFSFSNVLDWSGSGVSPNFENKINSMNIPDQGACVIFFFSVCVCKDLHGSTSWSGFFPSILCEHHFHREKMSIPAKRITQ